MREATLLVGPASLLANWAAEIERLGKLSGLRRLYVGETKVTQEGLAEFRKAHPSSVVSWSERPAPRVSLSPGKKNERVPESWEKE